MDSMAMNAVTDYEACERANRDDCNEQFEENIGRSTKGTSQAYTLKDLVGSYYACMRTTDDGEQCASNVQKQFEQSGLTSQGSDASPARTALEVQATAPAQGPSPDAVMQEAALARENPGFVANDAAFDPSALYEGLPKVNPIALVPLRDLVGRTRTDFVKNPFKLDPRAPVFPKVLPSEILGVPEERLNQLAALREKYKMLDTGVGYSARAYCDYPDLDP